MSKIRKIKARLKGRTEVSFSKQLWDEKVKGEKPEDREERLWPNKAHTKDGYVIVPNIVFKKMMASIASDEGEIMKGQKTYKDAFKRGILVENHSTLLIDGKPVKWDAKAQEKYHAVVPCLAQGGNGNSETRVLRTFPQFPANWECDVEFTITDERINDEVFLRHLALAGLRNGIGRFRPENGGDHGMFDAYVKGKLVEA